MGLISFLVELVVAYFLGIVLFYTFVFILAIIVAIGTGIYFIFKWIAAHIIDILGIIVLIAVFVHLARLAKRKRLIPRAYKSFKERLFLIGSKSIKIAKVAAEPVIEWNERHKPKDVKSMKKYGFTTFLVGLMGAIIFFADRLWYVALFYCVMMIGGIYQMLYPQKALERMQK